MRRAVIPPALAEAAHASGLSPAIEAGGFVFLTGATGGLPDGTMPGDAAAQALSALSKAGQVLAAAGAGPQDVVEVTSYHVDIAQTFSPVETVLREVFAAPLPAWTAVGVAALRRPGALVEFRIIAHKPGA